MDSSSAQACLVRGAETENRCSSCANAGVDLFFCSRDHQKLFSVLPPGVRAFEYFPPIYLAQDIDHTIIGSLP
ncbi:uncharacterized protein RHOBADRAFT_43693 [Rhodotorula graminis WP1]|uniref:Uncharacterized protein n=1 Tax=Rhodotorula graminis (strain WP1) TaxID=578459 RepID=A0A194S3V6_RHOGW|nr:uncharacterized protein RHOBADRAFT_43693 [Rhodotorula graminis WP1]KPV75204.1 hypothetical protein RHOBADRAFT_43693 [Rhodotorula graminis WP1]